LLSFHFSVYILKTSQTTAGTLAATFALLAVHPDIQDEIYQQIIDVVGPDDLPKFEDYHKLDKVLATFYEALRLFPPGFVMIREAIKDTTLIVPNAPGTPGSTTLPVQKGTWITVDVIGLQYNQRYFSDPDQFRPSRWQSSHEGGGAFDTAEAVTAFGLGARTCIGRRFATTEAVAFLTMWLRDWTIEPLLLPGETEAQWRARVLQAEVVLTLKIKDVPVRLRRRNL